MTEPYDAGDELRVDKRTKIYKLRKQEEAEALRAVLSNYAARSFLWKVLEQCGVYQTSFNPDPHITAFNEGKRQVGLWLISKLFETDPQVYNRMKLEAERKQETDEQNG